MQMTADLVNLVCSKVIGDGPTRDQDCNEFATRIHGIQHMLMAQSAARAHPGVYRLLGETLDAQP